MAGSGLQGRWRWVGLGLLVLVAGTLCGSLFLVTPPGSADVRVSVFVDVNGDGVRDDSDLPFPGLRLLLDGRAEAVTDDLGVAVFPGGPLRGGKVTFAPESLQLVCDYGLVTPGGTEEFGAKAGGHTEILLLRGGFLRVEMGQAAKADPQGAGASPAAPAASSGAQEVVGPSQDSAAGCGCGH